MSPSIMSTLSETYRTRQKVLGYPVDLLDQSAALKVIETAWIAEKSLQVITLNAEMVIGAQKDPRLDRIIRHAHLIVPDGAGIVWALKLAGQECQRLPGIELSEVALLSAAGKGFSVGLIGSKPEVISSLKERLPGLYPGLEIALARDGYFSPEQEPELVNDLIRANPRLLLVALGVPRQEYFIDRWQESFPKTVMIGVGGSFDIWAGVKKRAPKTFRRLHLEWLYRLLKEPWRLKRMSSTLPNFGLQVIVERWRRSNLSSNHKS